MKLTPGDIREGVNREVSDVHIDHRGRAADIVIDDARERGRELTDADLKQAFGLARRLAAWSMAKREPTEIRNEPLSDTAYSRQTEADWLDTFSPFVARVREKAFGSSDAPFGVDSLDEMQEWMEKADEEERWAEIDPDSQVGKLESEVRERIRQLKELAPGRFHFSQSGGFYFTYLDSKNDLRLMQIDSVPRSLRDGWFLDFKLPPIGVVAIAAHQIAEVTGFESHDVLLYILTGIPPRLKRVVTYMAEKLCYLPDGTRVTGWMAEVSIRTPDVTFRELLEVHRNVRSVWESLGHSHPGEQPQRRRLTKKDRQLMEILERLGGVPEKPTGKFWESVHERWEDAGYNAGPGKRKKADSHRRLWRILERKLEIPGVVPSVGAKAGERTTKED